MTEDDKIVPFGKYEGQPVTRLVEDDDYAEWLTSQAWFRRKFDDLYQLVINYGHEPQDTPEHNELQAKFLQEDWREALLKTAKPGLVWEADQIPLSPENQNYDSRLIEYVEPVTEREFGVGDPEFEKDGWDVVYGMVQARVALEIQEWPDCICECDHNVCPNNAACQGGKYEHTCEHNDCHDDGNFDPDSIDNRSSKHCNDQCLWADENSNEWIRYEQERTYTGDSFWTIRVECKPMLGDDYPSVLRQVKSYDIATDEWGDSNDLVIVVAKSTEFERVTWNEVVQIFENSNVNLVRLRDVKENLPNP